MPQLIRSHIGVRRTTQQGVTVGSFASMAAACRELAGTGSEISDAESRRIRAALRTGQSNVRDSLGYLWSATHITETTAPQQRRIRTIGGPVAEAVARTVAPVVPFASANTSWDQLTFGVELEVVATDRVAAGDRIDQLQGLIASFAGWRAVRDGSVNNGGEVVSPILKGEDGIRQLQQVCEVLKAAGFNANRSCGMHVHVGVRQFTIAQIGSVCRSMINNEQHFDSVVAESRRASNNHFCQSNTRMTVPSQPRNIAQLATAFNGGWDSVRHYTPYRYRKLNLQSYALHGTMEFRQHQGTVEAARAVAWVRLVTGFAAAGLNGDNGQMSFDEFAGLAGSQAGFISARREHFALRRAA
jgi:hypothetical protein